jgi:hypothetical protein
MTVSTASSNDKGSGAGTIPLASRMLSSDSELESFARMFESHGGNAVAPDYLRQANARGFFRGDELLRVTY